MPLGSASKSIVTFTDVGDVVGPGVEGGAMYTGAIVGDSADAKGATRRCCNGNFESILSSIISPLLPLPPQDRP